MNIVSSKLKEEKERETIRVGKAAAAEGEYETLYTFAKEEGEGNKIKIS